MKMNSRNRMASCSVPPNAQGERREAADDDVRFVSGPNRLPPVRSTLRVGLCEDPAPKHHGVRPHLAVAGGSPDKVGRYYYTERIVGKGLQGESLDLGKRAKADETGVPSSIFGDLNEPGQGEALMLRKDHRSGQRIRDAEYCPLARMSKPLGAGYDHSVCCRE